VERPLSEPGAGQVRIRVEACGVCHTDAATVMGVYPGLTLPRVPGHEVVGRIEALGSGISKWKIGQRVGVGLIAGEDGVCEPCRRGDIVNCQNPVTSGVTVDGGYAEVMIAEARALSSVRMSSRPQKPLLSCARASRPTTLFAMPACVAEIWSPCRGSVDLATLVFSLHGTWDFVLSHSDVAARSRSWRKIWARTSTSILPSKMPLRYCRVWAGRERFLRPEPVGSAMGSLVSGLAAHGKLIVVGVPQDQIQLNAFPLVFGGRSVYGSLTGTPIDGEDTLAFSVLENIRPMIETVPLEQAADAYARMLQGKARFRMVLVTKDGAA